MNLNFNVSEPVEKNNITAFFLSSIEKNNNKYLSFSEAIAKNQVQISEVNKKGLVTKLSVSNKSSDNIIILNGELIIGSQIRQDRIVDNTVLIPGYATVLINTFCGEQYRWSPKLSNKISTPESLYFSSGRANNAADTNTKLSKQCRIWSEISEKISDFNVKSFTNSVDQIYKKKKVNVEEIVNFFKIPSEAVGVVLGINNQLVNIDIFSNNCMLQIYLPKIIRSIALDSFKKISKRSYLKKKDVHRFLRQIHQANKQKRQVVEGALGEELQFNSESVAGFILYHKEQAVHFSAFVKENKTTLPQYEYEDKVA
jgi:hypothetical protein|tara:strand:- start:5 stop:943 length:939 start_codon:yes stop_codon:yes gene_type:complete